MDKNYKKRQISVSWHAFKPQRAKTYLLICAPKDHSDQTAHSRSLFRVIVVHLKKLSILSYLKYAQWRFWSDCANAQADQNLRWALVPVVTSDVAASFSFQDQCQISCLDLQVQCQQEILWQEAEVTLNLPWIIMVALHFPPIAGLPVQL